ncbi:glycosyltransferase involved in cell wall biosynthesis [Marisediminicola sp. UYEF4]
MARETSLFRDLAALWRWLKLIRQVRPEVTLIGTPKAALLGTVAARAFRVPYRVYELLGLRLETSVGPSRWVYRLMERLTAASAHDVVAVSESLRMLAIDLGITKFGHSSVLGAGSCNGVDTARFRQISQDTTTTEYWSNYLGIDDQIPVVGFVGRLTRDKGLPELAGALSILHDSGLELQLLVVGMVDDDSGHDALNLLNRTGQRIISAGYQDDVAPFYALMDVFCLPSLREGLPNVILEAMASRRVVVATDATGSRDLVEDGVSGYLVPLGSENELAYALRKALLDRDASASMVESALEMVEARYETSEVQFTIRKFLRSGLEARTSKA